tara:strand:+ start:131545 stop:132657 length:1113 start_codon:yes stop_codon:yes gene_type:complete
MVLAAAGHGIHVSLRPFARLLVTYRMNRESASYTFRNSGTGAIAIYNGVFMALVLGAAMWRMLVMDLSTYRPMSEAKLGLISCGLVVLWFVGFAIVNSVLAKRTMTLTVDSLGNLRCSLPGQANAQVVNKDRVQWYRWQANGMRVGTVFAIEVAGRVITVGGFRFVFDHDGYLPQIDHADYSTTHRQFTKLLSDSHWLPSREHATASVNYDNSDQAAYVSQPLQFYFESFTGIKTTVLNALPLLSGLAFTIFVAPSFMKTGTPHGWEWSLIYVPGLLGAIAGFTLSRIIPPISAGHITVDAETISYEPRRGQPVVIRRSQLRVVKITWLRDCAGRDGEFATAKALSRDFRRPAKLSHRQCNARCLLASPL